MPFLIDGHNLIGQLAGISLADPDDEARLVSLLAAFCARRSTKATVCFDHAAGGRAARLTGGAVTAHFVRRPDTADAAIERQLARLGRQAPNWTVVSSDQQVVRAARRAGARTLTSQEFAALLQPPPGPSPAEEKPDVDDDPGEVARWERLFSTRRRRRS